MIHAALWAVAIITFGIVDTATTSYFVGAQLAAEGNPIMAAAFDAHGVWILTPLKIIGFGAFYAIYRAAPREWSVGVPLGLALFGTAVAVNNILIGASAL